MAIVIIIIIATLVLGSEQKLVCLGTELICNTEAYTSPEIIPKDTTK